MLDYGLFRAEHFVPFSLIAALKKKTLRGRASAEPNVYFGVFILYFFSFNLIICLTNYP